MGTCLECAQIGDKKKVECAHSTQRNTVVLRLHAINNY